MGIWKIYSNFPDFYKIGEDLKLISLYIVEYWNYISSFKAYIVWGIKIGTKYKRVSKIYTNCKILEVSHKNTFLLKLSSYSQIC